MKFPPDGLRYGSWRDNELNREGQAMFWIWTLLGIWFVGFILTIVFNAIGSPNVTPALALLRAAVWPIFWATGWPHGVPLPMD